MTDRSDPAASSVWSWHPTEVPVPIGTGTIVGSRLTDRARVIVCSWGNSNSVTVHADASTGAVAVSLRREVLP